MRGLDLPSLASQQGDEGDGKAPEPRGGALDVGQTTCPESPRCQPYWEKKRSRAIFQRYPKMNKNSAYRC